MNDISKAIAKFIEKLDGSDLVDVISLIGFVIIVTSIGGN